MPAKSLTNMLSCADPKSGTQQEATHITQPAPSERRGGLYGSES